MNHAPSATVAPAYGGPRILPTDGGGRLLPPPVHSALYHAGLLCQNQQEQQSSGAVFGQQQQQQTARDGVLQGGINSSYRTPLQGRRGGTASAQATGPYLPGDSGPLPLLPSPSPLAGRTQETRSPSLADRWAEVSGVKALPSPSTRPVGRRPAPPRQASAAEQSFGVGSYFAVEGHHSGENGGGNVYVGQQQLSGMGKGNHSGMELHSYNYGGGCECPPQQQTPGGLSASQSATKSFMHHHGNSTFNSSGLLHSSLSPFSQRGRQRSAATSPSVLRVVSPSSASSCGLNGVPLERQLLLASKEELVQILLELGSCNADAATFIQSKANFFAFRHRPNATDEAGGGGGGGYHNHGNVAAAIDFSVASAEEEIGGTVANQRKQQGGEGGCDDAMARRRVGARSEHSSTGTASGRGGTGAAGETELSVNASSVRSDDVGAVTDDSPCSHQHERTQTREAEGAALPAGTPAKAGARGATAAVAAAVERQLAPHDRTFVAALHPCLRWYGTCRNTTSCIFAATPQNLCLNWVRGSCAAGVQCSGVHRLPDVCPPEVRTVFELSNGSVTRQEAMLAMVSAHDDQRKQQGIAATAAAAAVAEAVSTPEEQILLRDQHPFSSCGSPHPHTDRFVSSRDETELDEDAEGGNGGGDADESVSTPIGPRPQRENGVAPGTAACSPFRDYFSQETGSATKPPPPPTTTTTRGSAVSVRGRTPQQEERPPLPTTPAPHVSCSGGGGAGDVDRGVHRCLNDSFTRALGDDATASPTDTAMTTKARMLSGAAFRADSPPAPSLVVNSPLRLNGGGEEAEDFDGTAPCVGTRTRSHTPM